VSNILFHTAKCEFFLDKREFPRGAARFGAAAVVHCFGMSMRKL